MPVLISLPTAYAYQVHLPSADRCNPTLAPTCPPVPSSLIWDPTQTGRGWTFSSARYSIESSTEWCQWMELSEGICNVRWAGLEPLHALYYRWPMRADLCTPIRYWWRTPDPHMIGLNQWSSTFLSPRSLTTALVKGWSTYWSIERKNTAQILLPTWGLYLTNCIWITLALVQLSNWCNQENTVTNITNLAGLNLTMYIKF